MKGNLIIGTQEAGCLGVLCLVLHAMPGPRWGLLLGKEIWSTGGGGHGTEAVFPLRHLQVLPAPSKSQPGVKNNNNKSFS